MVCINSNIYVVIKTNINVILRANDVLLNEWRRKCRSGKLQAPYFLVDHPSVDLRPMPIDLAILYCAKEVMRTLLLSGADINHRYHHHHHHHHHEYYY